MTEVRAIAHPNIAVVKYWGKRDTTANLPAVSSLSLTIAPFRTETILRWGAPEDRFWLDGQPASPAEARRAFRHVDGMVRGRPAVAIESTNDFPTGAGLASSASGFAALTAAVARAAGLDESAEALSRQARLGSGSACRSLWGGWVRWDRGERPDGQDSHGRPVAGPVDVALVVAIVSTDRKAIGSTEAMERARQTSPVWPAWLASSEGWVDAGTSALQRGDLASLGAIMERSTMLMHATAWTSDPPVQYWQPATLAALQCVAALRNRGVAAWATMDAGPQVKVLCALRDADPVAQALAAVVPTVVVARPGPGPRVD